MRKLIGSWSFYKKALTIAVPVMIQNLITNFVAMIDNIMVGQIGTEQMSGVAIVNQLFFVFNLAVFGAVSGASIFCSQFFGKNDEDGIRHTFRFKLLSALIISVLGILIFFVSGENLISYYLHGADKGINLEETFAFAKQYMSIMLAGLIPFAFEAAYSSTLREGSVATPPMAAGIVAVITNTVLNYFLIFGIGIFPELGVSGAAIATVISRYVQIAIVAIWTHMHKSTLTYIKGLYRSLYVPKQLVKRIMIKGVIPLTANEILWAVGVAMLAQCYSMRGIDVVAGQNIATTVVNLFNVLFIAFGSGVAVVLGQLLGANDLDGARDAAPKLIFFSGALCVVVGAVMAVFSGVFPNIYNTTDNVKNLATAFIFISALTMPIHGIMHATYFTMRSGGKTVITFIFDCGFSWLILVPLAYCLVHFTDMHIKAIYFTCQMAELVKCILGIFLIKSGIWLSNIVTDDGK